MKAPANAAVSAYAAAGGRAAIIIAPPSTSLAKTAQFHTQGAAAALILGICPDTSAVERRVPNIFYVSHNWRLFFFEGKKTLADRLWESLGFATSDHVVVPCGAGWNTRRYWIGFSGPRPSERRRPRAVGRQPDRAGRRGRGRTDQDAAKGEATGCRAGASIAVDRVALLGFSIECNRFAPVSTEADFHGRA